MMMPRTDSPIPTGTQIVEAQMLPGTAKFSQSPLAQTNQGRLGRNVRDQLVGLLSTFTE
jgi:hypothetical protein